jgi:aldehyde:ferredoxin oxidoreductase
MGVPTFDQKYKTKKYACANCPLGCGANYVVNDGKWPLGKTERPEYETWGSFGGLCLNQDIGAVFKCNDICNRYGLDTISAGATVAWAIECYSNGILTKKDTGGIDLKWGNAEAMVTAAQQLADQSTPFGKLLAMGSAKAAATLGKGSEYLQTVKGIELPMHDPRFAPGYGRTYQFDPTPARHVKGSLALVQMQDTTGGKYFAEGTGFMDVTLVSMTEIQNCLGLCMFAMFTGIQTLNTAMMEAVTGESFKSQDALRAAARILHVRQAFNVREGIRPADLVMPARSIGNPPLEAGPLAGARVDAKRLGENWFNFVGWDQNTGKPSRHALELLGGLDDVAKDLYG